jgi:tungstate transport system permease protein
MSFWREDLLEIILLSLQVSGLAVFIGICIGVPLGALLGLFSFPGRSLLIAMTFTLMGFPTVLIGVLVYLLLSRYGLLGDWGWLFTPAGMTLAQFMLSAPIIAGLTMSAVFAKEKNISETAISLGASRLQLITTIVRESKQGILAAVATAFGRSISEVGAVMLVGGNIEGSTRVMTTAIILETRQGNFEDALFLGLVLLIVTFIVNVFLMLGFLKTFRA